MKLGNLDVSKLMLGNTEVDKIYLGTNVVYEKVTEIHAFKMSSSSGAFTLETYSNVKKWDGTLESSSDGTTWTTWDGTTAVSSSQVEPYVLYLRGTGNTYINTASNNFGFMFTGSNISLDNRIDYLLDYTTVVGGGSPTMSNYCYYYLFRGCHITNISADLLPATALGPNCYNGMFYDSDLTNVPSNLLPATTLANSCYCRMFGKCTGITSIPSGLLHSTALAGTCYEEMFYGCTNLISIPSDLLPALILQTSCYRKMFQACSSLKLSTTQTGNYTIPFRVPSSGTGTVGSGSLTYMFNGTGGTFKGTPTINTTYYLYDYSA